MKKVIFTIKLVFILLLSATFQLNGQSEEGLKLRPFGLGMHVEQFKLMDLYSSNSYMSITSNILISINAGQHFRIEPEIGYMSLKDEDSDSPSTGLSIGSGFFGMFNKKDVNFYIGLRINYSRAKMYDYNDEEEVYTFIKTGPAIGAEYYFSPHFSFGGEIGIKYATIKLNVDENNTNREDSTEKYFNTDTGLFVRFFF